jgi:hypothetical protein
MAHVRLRGVINQSGFAVTLAVSLAATSFFACAPSSGSGTSPPAATAPPGGGSGPAGAGGTPGGAPPNGGAPSGASGVISQGGVIGQGGISPGGFGNEAGFGNGGFLPGDGGASNGGFWGSTGGVPPGAGGTCGTNTVDPNQYPACTTCSGGRCVPTSLLQGNPVVSLLAACDGTSACVPEQIVVQAENLLLRGCTSIAGSEGRCTSLCIPAASNLSAYLPQDVCAPTERCVPCYSPNDGADLGICGLGCDPGPTGAPYVFGTCCGGAGRCAPKSAIPPATAQNLGSESCPSSDLCVPGAPISDPAYRFPCCSSTFGSGICAPACVLEQSAAGRALGQGSCASAGDKCVPCADLVQNPTGACTDRNGQVTNTCVP